MLINFENNQEIIEVWHKKEYNVWLDKIGAIDKNAIERVKDEIKKHLHENEVNVTSWMPGEDWTGTPYQVIYDAIGTKEESAKCFGLLVQECIIEDEKKWSFTKMDDVKGMVYFLIK